MASSRWALRLEGGPVKASDRKGHVRGGQRVCWASVGSYAPLNRGSGECLYVYCAEEVIANRAHNCGKCEDIVWKHSNKLN